MLRARYLGLTLLVALGVAHADPLVNLVVNPGFETGDFSGWSVTGNVTPCLFVGTSNDYRCLPSTGIGPHSGSYAAELGNYQDEAFLAQNVATTAGATYELSFWLASQDYGTPSNDFSVTWGNQQIFSAVNLPASGYVHYDFTGLVASGGSTLLTFGFHDNPSYLVLDDVSLIDPSPVPEPATPALCVLVLGALALARRNRWVRVRRSA